MRALSESSGPDLGRLSWVIWVTFETLGAAAISSTTSLLQQGSTRPPQSQLRAIELGACGLAKQCQRPLSRKSYRASSAGGQRAARRRSGNGRRDLFPAPARETYRQLYRERCPDW